MDCIYEFECEKCGYHFDDWANREVVATPEGRASIVRECPECSTGKARILPVQLVGHGQNHSSWSVKK